MTLVCLTFMAIVRFFDLLRIFRPSSCTRIWYCFKHFSNRCKRRQHDGCIFCNAHRTHRRTLTNAIRPENAFLRSYHTAAPNTPNRRTLQAAYMIRNATRHTATRQTWIRSNETPHKAVKRRFVALLCNSRTNSHASIKDALKAIYKAVSIQSIAGAHKPIGIAPPYIDT